MIGRLGVTIKDTTANIRYMAAILNTDEEDNISVTDVITDLGSYTATTVGPGSSGAYIISLPDSGITFSPLNATVQITNGTTAPAVIIQADIASGPVVRIRVLDLDGNAKDNCLKNCSILINVKI